MKFKQLLSEVPHLEFLKGKVVDLKREKYGPAWILDELPSIFRKYKKKKEEIADRLLHNVGFYNIFKHDFERLPTNDKNRILKRLPKHFWDVYNKMKV